MSKHLLAETKRIKIYHDRITHNNGVEEYVEYVSLFNDTLNSVMVAAINNKDEVIFIEQYLPALQKIGLVLPGGKVDGDESPSAAAARELAEETNYFPKRLEKLTSVEILPKYVYGITHLFIANSLELTDKYHGDEVEDIKTTNIPIVELLDHIKSGRISDSRSVVLSMYLYFTNMNPTK